MTFDASILRSAPLKAYALTDAATIATDCNNGGRFTVSIATGRTLGAPTNARDGEVRVWEVKNTSGGAVNLTLTATSGGWLAMETVEGSPVATGPTTVPIPAGEVAVLYCYFSASEDRWIPISTLASV